MAALRGARRRRVGSAAVRRAERPHQSYHTAITFMFVGVLTLPPALLVLLVVVMHVPEWLKHRYAWYIQSFNIANYVLDVFAARATIALVGGVVGTESATASRSRRSQVAFPSCS